jgi:hypothetical protein
MLPDRLHGSQSLSIQLLRAVFKSPLRRTHQKLLAGKITIVIVGKTMNSVAFGHGTRL